MASSVRDVLCRQEQTCAVRLAQDATLLSSSSHEACHLMNSQLHSCIVLNLTHAQEDGSRGWVWCSGMMSTASVMRGDLPSAGKKEMDSLYAVAFTVMSCSNVHFFAEE
jgi:hypothetical protein